MAASDSEHGVSLACESICDKNTSSVELRDLVLSMMNSDGFLRNSNSWNNESCLHWWTVKLPDILVSLGHNKRPCSEILCENWYFITWEDLKRKFEAGIPLLSAEENLRNWVHSALQIGNSGQISVSKKPTCCQLNSTDSVNIEASTSFENPYLHCYDDIISPINPSEYTYHNHGTFFRSFVSKSIETSESFEVLLSRDDFKFGCAHFVVFKGFRERLHGHNYRVGVRIIGRLNSDGYVVDFGDVKAATRLVCKRLNEHVLIPQLEPDGVLRVISMDDAENIRVEVLDQSGKTIVYQFPTDDVLVLPIAHTTAEELARYLFKRILIEIGGHDLVLSRGVREIEVIVSEVPGQQASFRHEIANLDNV